MVEEEDHSVEERSKHFVWGDDLEFEYEHTDAHKEKIDALGDFDLNEEEVARLDEITSLNIDL